MLKMQLNSKKVKMYAIEARRKYQPKGAYSMQIGAQLYSANKRQKTWKS
jgi:hypothetical protein